MKAILPVTTQDADGKSNEEMLLFDTEKATKLCDVINAFGFKVQTIYLSPGGILFLQDNNSKESLEVGDQRSLRKYIGEHYPDVYQKHFGKAKEA